MAEPLRFCALGMHVAEALEGPVVWRALGGVSLLGSGLPVAAALRAIGRVVRRRPRHAPSA